jgi:hypothetical protein
MSNLGFSIQGGYDASHAARVSRAGRAPVRNVDSLAAAKARQPAPWGLYASLATALVLAAALAFPGEASSILRHLPFIR